MSQFPAIIIGGPPHSGKSVLVYSLTQALRKRNIAHYVLRACPDGEGDWANEADQALVRSLRQKGPFSPAFTQTIVSYLERRQVALLVDVGGRPTEEQLAIFKSSSHAILLIGDRPDEPDQYERDRAAWLSMADGAGLAVLADLRSDLWGTDELVTSDGDRIRGTIARLERGNEAKGPTFDALVNSLAELCGTWDAVQPAHEAARPRGSTFIDLPDLADGFGSRNGWWHPEQLPLLTHSIRSTLRKKGALALYGRAANWAYAAAALAAQPDDAIRLFDVKEGWMRPPALTVRDVAITGCQEGWSPEVREETSSDGEAFTLLTLKTASQYLDPSRPEGLPLPLALARTERGLVLSGRMPNWLLVAAARATIANRPWLAVFQPQLGGVIVASRRPARSLGSLIEWVRSDGATP